MRPVPLIQALDVARFGVEAVQLALAAQAGLPVPQGFALEVTLVGLLVEGVYRAEDLASSLVEKLGGGFVGVRASYPEDVHGVPGFDVQFDHVAGLATPAEVARAILQLWQSANSLGARANRGHEARAEVVGVAAVVKRAVDADCSGVLRTRCVPEQPGVRSLEAAWGLGEAVLRSMVVPDRYRWRIGGTSVEPAPGSKEVEVVLGEGGTLTRIVPPPRNLAPCLNDERIAALEQLAQRCDDVFGEPSDIEWAFERGSPAPWLLRRRVVAA